MAFFISHFCVGICADFMCDFKIIWLLIVPTTYLISQSRNEKHTMIMTCMYACALFLYSYFLYVYMVLHYLAFMYYALILLCQEWRNKDVQSINQSVTNTYLNSSLPGQNGRHFTDDIFRCIFLNETICISIQISLKFVPGVQLTITQHWFR